MVFAYRFADGTDGPDGHDDGIDLPWIDAGDDLELTDLTPGVERTAVDLTDGRMAWPTGVAPVARVVEIKKIR